MKWKTWKKLTAALLAAGLLVGLAACAPEEPAPTDTPPAASAPEAATPAPEDTPEPAGAQQPEGYPSKTITWIVPAAAGATIDLPTRALADSLDLGGSIVVENIAGASQTLGATEAVNRGGDGYTLLTGANAWGLIQPNMNEVAYSTDDFRHLCFISAFVHDVLVVPAASDIQSVEDWIAYVTGGSRFTYGIPATGGHGHLALTTTLNQLGADTGACVAYSNAGENIAALLSGTVEFGVLDSTDAAPRVEAGELRAIAILSDEPSGLLPDVPAITDYNVTDIGGFKGLLWVAVHKDTPDEIVEWLKVKIDEAVHSDAYQAYLKDSGRDPLPEYTEEEVTQYLKDASTAYQEVLTSLGLAAG